MFTQKQKEVIIYPLIISFICSFFFSAMVVLNFIPNEGGMGFAPSSGYNETITVALTAAATTINVSSVKDDDGIQLALSTSNKGYFTIDPGQTNAERVVCTGVSGSTLTGCTRGLSSSGSSETGSSTLASTHDVGSRIIMTNIAQFYSNYVNIWDAQTVAGIKDFSSRPTTSTSTPTDDDQVATIYDLNNATTSGGLIATESIRGTGQLATAAEQAGNSFNSLKPQLISTKYASSTSAANYAVITGSDGKIDQTFLDLTEDYTWSGNNTHSATNTFSGYTNFTGTVAGITGVVISMTASSTINGDTLPVPVYIATSTGAVNAVDGNDRSTLNFFGFATSNAVNGGSIDVQTSGIVSGFTGLTVNALYYVQDTAGTIGTTVGTYKLLVGQAISSTQILIKKEEPLYAVASTNDYLVLAIGPEASGGNTSYTKRSTINVGNMDGTVNVSFEIKNHSNHTTYARIYVNGVAVGTERTNNTTTYIEFNETIAIDPYDDVEIWLKTSDAEWYYLRNFLLQANTLTTIFYDQ